MHSMMLAWTVQGVFHNKVPEHSISFTPVLKDSVSTIYGCLEVNVEEPISETVFPFRWVGGNTVQDWSLLFVSSIFHKSTQFVYVNSVFVIPLKQPCLLYYAFLIIFSKVDVNKMRSNISRSVMNISFHSKLINELMIWFESTTTTTAWYLQIQTITEHSPGFMHTAVTKMQNTFCLPFDLYISVILPRTV